MGTHTRTHDTEKDHATTDILKRTAPIWFWLRENFKPPALFAILAMLGGLGGWVINLKTRVVVLETKVIPYAEDHGRMDALEQRVQRLEDEWDTAAQIAPTAPTPHRRNSR